MAGEGVCKAETGGEKGRRKERKNRTNGQVIIEGKGAREKALCLALRSKQNADSRAVMAAGRAGQLSSAQCSAVPCSVSLQEPRLPNLPASLHAV